ncbi:MAG: Holliday junction resolvase RuvX [Gracilibacteraceae bacterium]|nr:Holliday junction resolvase RuvX [Gracilibacteraceae bacterium]
MRIMGLDLGDATIGVAVSDELGMIAHGITTIRRKSIKYDIDCLKNIICEKDIKRIIVGLPKNMNNTIGPRGEKTIEFVRILKQSFPGIEVEMWDERLTTCAAERTLLEADVRRKDRKKVIDKLAAVLILQCYLDNMKNDNI